MQVISIQNIMMQYLMYYSEMLCSVGDASYFYSEHHDAVFVVGGVDETLILRGMRYHPIDVENSVLRSHKKIAEW